MAVLMLAPPEWLCQAHWLSRTLFVGDGNRWNVAVGRFVS
jgi:hypothetical protein